MKQIRGRCIRNNSHCQITATPEHPFPFGVICIHFIIVIKTEESFVQTPDEVIENVLERKKNQVLAMVSRLSSYAFMPE